MTVSPPESAGKDGGDQGGGGEGGGGEGGDGGGDGGGATLLQKYGYCATLQGVSYHFPSLLIVTHESAVGAAGAVAHDDASAEEKSWPPFSQRHAPASYLPPIHARGIVALRRLTSSAFWAGVRMLANTPPKAVHESRASSYVSTTANCSM